MKRKIKTLFSFSESDSFKTKVKRGLTWTIGITVWTRGLGLVSTIIVTRILNPDDFGLMAIAASVVAIITGLTNTGFYSAIIQKQTNPEELLNAAWTLEFIKGLILFLIIQIAAPYFATYFGDERLDLMFRVLSLTLLIKGVENIGVIWFRKTLDIRKEFIFGAIPDLFYLIVVVILVFTLKSVWALIIATVFTAFVKTTVSFFIHPFRPKFEFNLVKFRELFSFGIWIFGSSLVVMIRNQGVSLFVAKVFDVGILGNYNRGEAFSKKIFNEISKTLWKVGFPAFSMISMELHKFKTTFLLALRITTIVGFPLIAGLYILTPDIIKYMLTDKWAPIVPIIQLFTISAIPTFIHTPVGISFQALGRPAVNTKLAFVNTALFLLMIYPVSIRYGIQGVILASLLCNLLILPIAWFKIAKILNINLYEFLFSFLPQFFISALMALIIYFVKGNIFELNSFWDLIIYATFGGCIYFCLLWFSDKFLKTGFKEILYILIK